MISDLSGSSSELKFFTSYEVLLAKRFQDVHDFVVYLYCFYVFTTFFLSFYTCLFSSIFLLLLLSDVGNSGWFSKCDFRGV